MQWESCPSSFTFPRLIRALVLAAALIFVRPARAMESDAYVSRPWPLEDGTPLIERYFQARLDETVGEWNESRSEELRGAHSRLKQGPRARQAKRCTACSNEYRFAAAFADRIAGPELPGTFERWLENLPEAYRFTPGDESIYAQTDLLSSRLLWLANLHLNPWSASQLRVNGERVGVDKFDHFVSEGFKYFDFIERQGRTEEEAYREGETWEENQYGLRASGVFSNADLIANAEGLRFYRNLFRADERGLSPLLAWDRDGRIHLLRPFRLSDHVTALMDELRNPSYFSESLWEGIRPRLLALCPLQEAAPRLFDQVPAEAIQAAYPGIRFRHLPEQRLNAVCVNHSK